MRTEHDLPRPETTARIVLRERPRGYIGRHRAPEPQDTPDPTPAEEPTVAVSV